MMSKISFVLLLASVGLALSGCTSPAPTSQSESVTAQSLVGEWTYNGRCLIELKDGTITVVNEAGTRATATLSGNTLTVPAWSITGTVTADGHEIRWSNTTTWKR